MLSGTGVRDGINGGYVEPQDARFSEQLSSEIAAWQQRYETAHFAGFPEEIVGALDDEGIKLTSKANGELGGHAIGYYSHGRMKRLV